MTSYMSSTKRGSFMVWFHCKNPFFRLITQKVASAFFCGSPHGDSPTSLFKGFSCLCRGGPMCPPASEIIVDFANMPSKIPFFQWNHYLKICWNFYGYHMIFWDFYKSSDCLQFITPPNYLVKENLLCSLLYIIRNCIDKNTFRTKIKVI